MSKLLAVEWDDREIRAVAGVVRGRDILVERIQRVALPARTEEAGQSTSDIAKIFAELVSSNGWKKQRTLISVGRSLLELKELSLPPAPDDELPDMVRFQAQREFNNLAEDWPLDFLTIPGEPSQPRSVIAAAMPPAAMRTIREICATANVQLDQITLRPCAAASLLNLRQPEPMQVRLFVDVLPTELDLTVLTGATPEFMRTARLPVDHEGVDAQRTILNEIRRTIAAASNRLHGRRIDKIVLCDEGIHQSSLAELIERELKLPTVAFDPLTDCELSPEAKQNTPPEHSHFAPLLGILVEAAAERAPQIDFIHPHRKPEPPDRRRIWSLAGMLAACVVLVGGWFVLSGLWELDDQTAAVRAKIQQANAKDKQQKKYLKEIKDIDDWLASDLTMIAELKTLAEKMPSSKELVLHSVTYSAEKNGGRFVLIGNATSDVVVNELVAKLEALNPPDAPPSVAGVKSTASKNGKPASPILQKSSSTGKPAPARPNAAKAAVAKTYRPVLQPTKIDPKNTKYPQSFTVLLHVDNPGPILKKLGPEPSATSPAAAPKSPAGSASTSPINGHLIARASR
ncbi:MAG: hypothetical protein QM811_28840 [Pirellulales bacterium]